MQKEKATEVAQSKSLCLNDTSASSQRARVIHALHTGAKTTLELRADHGVLMPAPRIFELKNRGWGIAKTTIKAFTLDGVLHSGIARYYLTHEPIARPVATGADVPMPPPAAQISTERRL